VRIGTNILEKRRFPSAHAWLAFFIAGFYLFYRPLFIIFFLVATVIALSRVYLRVHEIVDVVFSSSIGLAIGMLTSIFIFHIPLTATLI
jgi:undecaprenyl-diphosphatase